MEVHAHSHTERKKWTHYFWEFLMLFLAVFCGFLAEYQLEHKIEKERSVQYIRSFYKDLKTDTAEFSFQISMYEEKRVAFLKRNNCFDSMSSQLNNSNPCIAELIQQSTSFTDLVTADQTLLQLKNAGGLRLLKQEDADSILAYDRGVRLYIKGETSGFQERQYRMRELIHSMLSYKNLEREDQSVPFLAAGAKNKINIFFVALDDYANVCLGQEEVLQELKQTATSLLTYFKNKYRLE